MGSVLEEIKEDAIKGAESKLLAVLELVMNFMI